MHLVSSCSCLYPILWSQVISWEWRCSWSSTDRRCSNYIWEINNLIAYQSASYIRDLTVIWRNHIHFDRFFLHNVAHLYPRRHCFTSALMFNHAKCESISMSKCKKDHDHLCNKILMWHELVDKVRFSFISHLVVLSISGRSSFDA